MSYVSNGVNEWSDGLSRLSGIGLARPHAAYSALTHGLLGRWIFYPERCLILVNYFFHWNRLSVLVLGGVIVPVFVVIHGM